MKKNGSVLAYLLFAATFIAIGVCFIGFTSASINVMCYLIGGITVLAAAFNAVVALAGKKRGGGFYLKMILCIFALVCGIVVFINREGALEYIVGAAAFLSVIETSFKLQTAVRGKSLKAPLWWGMVFVVVACYLCEGYLLKFYNPEAPKLMVALLGGLLILDGLLNLVTPLYLGMISKREREEMKKEVEEAGKDKKEKNKKKKNKNKEEEEREHDDDGES